MKRTSERVTNADVIGCDRRASDVVLRSLRQPDQPVAISNEFGRRLHLTVANRTG